MGRAEPRQKLVNLIYKREGKTETFTGMVESPARTFHFAGATFKTLLEFAGEALQCNPGHRLLMRREEAPYPMTLPENIEELLRTDINAAVRALTVEPQRVVVEPIRKPKTDLLGTLRHGHDTLADALGEELYLRSRTSSRGMQVEDPATGRWAQLELRDKTAHCGNLPLQAGVHPSNSVWVVARTADVIALGLSRYYLPRRWNPNQGWITHESLIAMYELYIKEKSDVSTI